MSGLRGYNLKQVEFSKGFGAAVSQVSNIGKVLPATATGTIFTVTGAVIVTNLVGVVSTALAVTAVHVSVGITGSNTAIAANGAATLASTPIGNSIIMPGTLGGQLPAPVSASGAAPSLGPFEVEATNITITTDATNTGAITWLLSYMPLQRKVPGSVAAV